MVNRILSTSERVLTKQSSSILSAATVITGASFLSALLGILRNYLLVSRFFGTVELRQQLDAYWVAFRIPELVFQLLVIGAMSAAFIPIFSKYYEKSKDDANELANSMLNLVLLIFSALSIVIIIFAPQFNSVITAANFTPQQVAMAATLTRVMLLAQLSFAASNFMTGIIQAHHRFLLPALAPLAYNIGIIIGIVVLSPILGIYGPAVGVVLGAILHLLIQMPLAYKLGFRYKPFKIVWDHPGIKEMSKLIPPRALAISVDQLELFASVYFTTGLTAGSLTVLNLAQQLMNAPTRVFSVPIGQASLPFLSQEVAKKQLDSFKKTLTQTLNQVLFLAFPASALLLVLRIPLVRIAYGAAEFPWSATLQTGKLVAIFSIVIFAYGGIHVLTRAFYALHDTKTPFMTALGCVLLSIGLMSADTYIFKTGIFGIGISLALSTLCQFVILFTVMYRKYQVIDLVRLRQSQVFIVTAAVLMGVGLWVPMRFLDKWVFDTTRTLPLIALTVIVSIIGGAIYLGLAYLFKIKELEAFSSLWGKFSHWRTTLSASNEVIETTSQTEEVKPW